MTRDELLIKTCTDANNRLYNALVAYSHDLVRGYVKFYLINRKTYEMEHVLSMTDEYLDYSIPAMVFYIVHSNTREKQRELKW